MHRDGGVSRRSSVQRTILLDLSDATKVRKPKEVVEKFQAFDIVLWKYVSHRLQGFNNWK